MAMRQLESTTYTRLFSYLNFVVLSTRIPRGFSEYSMSSRMSAHYALQGGARQFLFVGMGWHHGCLCCARGAVGWARHTYVWSPSCGLWRPHMSGETGGGQGAIFCSERTPHFRPAHHGRYANCGMPESQHASGHRALAGAIAT